MWGRKTDNRLLIMFPKEADDFISTNNMGDSSLYAGGLPYTAKDARIAVSNLFAGLLARGLYSKITLSINPLVGNSASYTPTTTLTTAEVARINNLLNFYRNELS